MIQDESKGPVEEGGRLAGTLYQFIHNQELLWRLPSVYELIVPVACYVRNKEYTPETLRTPDTLSCCCEYLLTKVLPMLEDTNLNRTETWEFLKDRLRAVRCQAYIQGYTEATMLEQMLRFHLICAVQTGDLAELRATLDVYYSGGKFRYTPLTVLCLLLLSIDGKGYTKVLAALPSSVLDLPCIQECIKIANSLHLGDFHLFLGSLDKADFLEGCLLYLFCQQARRQALRAFSKAQVSLPLDYLTSLFFFDSSEKLLNYLQNLGYPDASTARARAEKTNKPVFISLKMPELIQQDSLPGIPNKLWSKQRMKTLSNIMIQKIPN